MPRVCVDAGFLIGLYDPSDQHHQRAASQFEMIFGEESGRHTLILPWPILYEALGTRFSRDRNKVASLEQTWMYLERAGRLAVLSDEPYRTEPLSEQVAKTLRPMSLADRVLRAMILDVEPNFEFFLTYNVGDFIDACSNSGVRLISADLIPEEFAL